MNQEFVFLLLDIAYDFVMPSSYYLFIGYRYTIPNIPLGQWWPRCSVCIDNFRYSLYSQSRIFKCHEICDSSKLHDNSELSKVFWINLQKEWFYIQKDPFLSCTSYTPRNHMEKVVSVGWNRIENWLYGQNFYVWFIQLFGLIQSLFSC